MDGHCPLCGTSQQAQHFREQIAGLAQIVAEASDRLASLTTQYAEATRRSSELRAELTPLSNRLTALKQAGTELDAERDTLAQQASRLGVPITDATFPVLRLEAEVKQNQDDILQIERALAVLFSSRAIEQVADLEKEQKAAREELTEIDKRLARVRAANSQVKEAFDTVRRVRGEFVNEQLAQLEPLLLELYQRLRPHVDWPEVHYRLRGDVRKMLSLEVGDGINPSFVFSSGQRRAAGLAFLLAVHLARSWCKLQTLVLDDPVQHIDDYRALQLTEVLAALGRTGRQIICTVEDHSLARLLARRLRSQGETDGTIVHMAYSSSHGIFAQSVAPVHPFPRNILVPA